MKIKRVLTFDSIFNLYGLGRIRENIGFVKQRDIIKSSLSFCDGPITVMNVAKNMHFWLNLLHLFPQLCTPSINTI